LKVEKKKIKCKQCNGSGRGDLLGSDTYIICSECGGIGTLTLDWIEAIVGRKPPFTISSKKLNPKHRMYLGGIIIETD